MKTIIRIIAAISVMALMSCSKEIEKNGPKVIKDFPVIEVEGDVDAPAAEADPATKIYGYVANPATAPGKHTIKWKAGDQISQFSIVYSDNSYAAKGTVINFSNLRSTLKNGDGTTTFTMQIPDLKTLYGASSGVTSYLCAIYPATTLDVQVTSIDGNKINATATPDPSTSLVIPDVQDGTGWKYSIFIARSATFSAAYNNPTGGGGSKFNLMSALLRLKLNSTKDVTKLVLTNTTGFMTGAVGSFTMNSFHYPTDVSKNFSIGSGCPGKTLTIETGDVLPNDLLLAIREVREGTDFTFTFTASDGTTTTRSFSNPAGYSNRMMKKVLYLGELTLDDWN